MANGNIVMRHGNVRKASQVTDAGPLDLAEIAAELTGGAYTPIVSFGPGSRDAFNRIRTSFPKTIFDSKQLLDAGPLLWDDQEVSGGSTTSTHTINKANSIMGVGATTAGVRTRQTFRRLDYQPGKSQIVLMTGNLKLSGGGTGIVTELGQFDDNNGAAFLCDEGTAKVRLRSKVTGSVDDTNIVARLGPLGDGVNGWNIDQFDGSGPSGITFDVTKSQIFGFDYEWLSVGAMLFFLVYNRTFFPAHLMDFAGTLEGAYMSTPNLPLRYQITNDGTGAASTMSHICTSVSSEGGNNPKGIPQYESNAASDTAMVEISADTADTIYAIVGLRLKAAAVLSGGGAMEIRKVSIIAETADDFEWILLHNPTVTGTFVFGDKANSAMQVARGATATVAGGHRIDGGVIRAESSQPIKLDSTLSLGSAIDGTPDEVVLCVRPLTANANIHGGINWNEF